MVAVLRTPARPRPQANFISEFSFMKNLVSRFVKDESGATAIEYGLIAAGISVAIITAVNGLGTKINSNFEAISGSLK
jgi:pilus assembly protein Flp/PilA